MKKQLFSILIFTFLLFPFASAQNSNSNCPPLYTRSLIRFTNINIVKVDIIDSNKYSNLPKFALDKDSIVKLIMYPEIAKRASIEGDVVVKITIDSSGLVRNASVIKGIGAGCDEAAIDILLKTNYRSAVINNEKVPSEIMVWVNFSLVDIIDKPDMRLDEIIYEDNDIYEYKKLVLDKSGNVNYFEVDKWEEDEFAKKNERKGRISSDIYSRLSDFIIAQCFLDYKKYYYSSFTDHERRETVTVVTDTIEKYVSSNGKGDPVGLWAILNLIKYFENQIEWEEMEK